ncbi:MAG TPA: hypothetical protein VFE47_07085 [Tepidisphaeraceae bacterium]|jgi:hypothetical protein|nr:hypothetical protein [Tepidisphaeraceae bacterium]
MTFDCYTTLKDARRCIPFAPFILLFVSGCIAPSARLDFPTGPVERSARGVFYDVQHTGKPDFALLADERGKFDILAYADAGDGQFNRKYRLSQYANEDVPHLIILLDSIPYQKFADACAAGRFAWFDPPVKVIPPFPTLTELIFSKMLGAPPLPGMIDQYYDRDTGVIHDDLFDRVVYNKRESWERRLHYCATMYQSGEAYLNPRPWLAGELQIAKETFDKSPDRVTLVYFTSASAMLSRFGEAGLNEVIDGIERMCLRILYERQGAVKISILADHGHNLMESTNVALEEPLQAAGFHPTTALKKPNDVVLEINGLVTYAGVRTNQPAAVAKALAADKRIELAMYLEGERVIVCSSRGKAAVECRGRQVRYVPIDFDVLGYNPVIEKLRGEGKVDADGFVADAEWFSATLDHEYPDAPRRVWDAFHGTVTHPPEVMLVIRDGYCAGNPAFEKYVHMASTHGGLNQINSATFLMSMTGRAKKPLKSAEVLPTIEPGFWPSVR